MKLKLIIYPYTNGENYDGFNSRGTQAKYFCDNCIYFETGMFCTASKGHVTNRYLCAEFKKYKLKKL